MAWAGDAAEPTPQQAGSSPQGCGAKRLSDTTGDAVLMQPLHDEDGSLAEKPITKPDSPRTPSAAVSEMAPKVSVSSRSAAPAASAHHRTLLAAGAIAGVVCVLGQLAASYITLNA